MTLLALCWGCIFQALVLLLVANGVPVIVNKILDKRWAWPIDNGLKMPDQQRLFGDTKTWRGCFFAVLLTTSVSFFIGLNAFTGLLFGLLTMAGDLLASFLKRRRGNAESSHARGLDTVPESLLPIWLLNDHLDISTTEIALIIGLFFLIEEFASPILYRLHIRKRPY
ncbi:MAG: CDP-archaeol synthase [Methylococcaceae bacterium]|nr:CDP-archaeol synthase [Methylococcaceae bacterium]